MVNLYGTKVWGYLPMDLIDSLSNAVNISEVTVKNSNIFEEVSEKFNNLMFLAFSSSKQLQDLLPKLIEECGDVDSYDEWEPQMYLNFKDLVVTPKGIRGLTDGFWSWGVAFSYERTTGYIHIDLRCSNDKGLTTVVTDIAGEVQEQINAYFDELITKNPQGLVVTLEGYLTLSESSYA